MLALVLAALPTVSTPAGPKEASAVWCQPCHRAQHEAWARSRHGQAATNRLYVTNHRQEPMRWCDGCHAPLGVEAEGVGCASCHVEEGQVLTSGAPSQEGLAAHEEREAEALRTPAACQRCHQVNFPVGKHEPVTFSRWPMQNTVEEWSASGTSKPCQRCHLPEGDHAMTGGHDLARVREALEVSMRRIGGGEVRLTMQSHEVAHAVPTGDPFRAFRVDVTDGSGEIVTTRRFGRTMVRASESWRLVDDWTIPAPTPLGGGARSFEFAVPPSARGFTLTLIYVGEATAALLDPQDTEAEVLRGTIDEAGSSPGIR